MKKEIKYGTKRIRRHFCLLPYKINVDGKQVSYWLQNIWIEEIFRPSVFIVLGLDGFWSCTGNYYESKPK